MELFSVIQEVLAEQREFGVGQPSEDNLSKKREVYLEEDDDSGLFSQPDFESKVAWVKKNKPEIKDPDAYVAAALRKAGEIEEISTAGGASASIEGTPGTIRRDEFVEELNLRELLRKAIKFVHKKQKENFLKEQKVRSIIRGLIKEASPTEDPHESTGINVLKVLLRDIIKQLRSDYVQLTTNPAQRKSFRAHILSAVEDTLKPMMIMNSAPEEPPVIFEDIEVDVDDRDPTDDEAFIPVEDDEEESPMDKFGLEGQNKTGRNMAFETFKEIGPRITSAFAKLEDREDQEIFYDYLLINLKLHFDKFERQLDPSLEEPGVGVGPEEEA